MRKIIYLVNINHPLPNLSNITIYSAFHLFEHIAFSFSAISSHCFYQIVIFKMFEGAL